MQCFVLGGFRTVGVKARIARTSYFRLVGRASLVPESPKALFEKLLRSISGDAGSPLGSTSYLSTRCMAGIKKKETDPVCIANVRRLPEMKKVDACSSYKYVWLQKAPAWRKQRV